MSDVSTVLLEFCGFESEYSAKTARKMAEEILRLREEVKDGNAEMLEMVARFY